MTYDRRVAAFFDGCAHDGVLCHFDDLEGERVTALMERWRIAPGDRVVEPGCGSGRLTERLARAIGPSGRILAFDVSAGMLALARGRRLPAQAALALASALAIPSASEAFDAVVCFNSFPHLRPPGAALNEMARILRPGGSLWLCHSLPRAQLANVHRTAGTAVADHTLPSNAELTDLVTAARLRLTALEDRADGFLLHAVR